MRHAWLLGLIFAGCSSERSRDSVRPDVPRDSSFPEAPPPDSTTTPWQIGPTTRGPLSRRSSAADLRRHYGAQNLEPTRIELGEG
jgi:hypothetical protein